MRISDWSSDVCSSDLGFPPSAAVRRPRSCFMSHVDIRSAARPDPDQPMVDIADYVIDAKIDSPEASDTARSMLLRSEERRVGKECDSTCRSRWSPYPSKKRQNHRTRLISRTIK